MLIDPTAEFKKLRTDADQNSFRVLMISGFLRIISIRMVISHSTAKNASVSEPIGADLPNQMGSDHELGSN